MFKYPLSTSNYELLHLVGVGTYSRVYESNCRDNNQVIAVKQINLEEFPLELETIQRQTAFWSKCEHPNVVKYYASFIDGSTLWILNEYMGAGSLKDIIKLNYQNGFKNEQLIAALLAQVVMGVKFFHDNHEIHRDIRTNNILVNSEGFVKLGDFGLATSLVKGGTRQGSTLSLFGEECYMAPEVLRNENGYSEKTDIWSLGLTAIELGTGKMPYAGMKFMESLAKIINSDPPCLPETGNFSLQYREFVKLCMIKQVSKRASSKDLLNSKFIKFVAKGPEIVQRIIMSSLPSVADMYKQINLSEKNLPNDIQIVKDGNIQDAPPPNTNPVQTVGRFKVTRTESLPKNQSHMPINIQFQDQIPKEQNLPPHDQNDSNSHQKEIEDLATELLQLSEEMQQLQKENSCLKRKMEDITAVISNIQDKKKNSQ